ncbi:hypothetical protein [Deferrisoma palaeochoriense]
MRTPLAVLFLLVCLAGPARAGDVSYRLVEPADPAHDLLPKTCRVCHKDKDFRFFVVVAPDDQGLQAARNRLEAGGPAPAANRPKNPHTAIACLFCHLEDPAQTPPGQMTFRTLDGGAAGPDRIEAACGLCHPGGSEDHPLVLGAADPTADLEEAGLPLPGGEPACYTCHDLHSEDVGPAAVRKAYLRFAAQSPASFVHGNRAGCRACHPGEPAPGSDPVFLEPDATARCVRCHTGGHEKIHPVGVASTEQTYPMDFQDLPLGPEGKITCSTCHDEPCTERIDPRNPRFLRGGPYLTPTEFCYRCHPRAGAGALNPHDQVTDDGRLVSTSCVFCHRKRPGEEGPGALAFLHSPLELCMGCHDPAPHPTVNHLVEMPEPMEKKLHAYEERHRVRLPLHEGQIVCTTCHNPHEKGAVRGEAALGAGEEKAWRVPSFAELCTPCHARYD